MGIHIGIGGLKIGRHSGGGYWKTRFPSGLTATYKSDTEIDLSWTNNGNTDYTGHKVYYSTDGVTYTLKATIASIGTTYLVTGLTADTLYYFKILAYKTGTLLNSVYSNVASMVTWIVLQSDSFTGVTINTAKWAETDPNSVISQNETLILTLAHAANISEFVNTLISVNSVASGVAVAQGYLTWTTDGAQVAIGGIYLYKDANNYASITSRATAAGDKIRLRVMTGGVSRYDLNAGATITKTKNVKIWTNGTDIKFYYLDTTVFPYVWTQMGATQTFSLGYPLLFCVSCVDNTLFTGGNPVNIDNVFLSRKEYTETYPSLEFAQKSTSYCWFARPKAIYNAAAGLTWIGQVHNDGSGYSQHVLTVNNATGAISTFEVGSNPETDDHNEPTILVRASDNKLFICYTEHAANKLIRYRISTNALDATAWEAEQTKDVGGDATNNVTYPSCFQASNGDIFIFFRDLYHGWSYIKSTDGGGTFGSRVIFYYGGADDIGEDGTGRGYMTFAQSPIDADIIHMVTTDGHPASTDHTVSVFGIYFDMADSTVHKVDGTNVTANIPLADPAYMTSIMVNVLPDTGWVEDVIVDSNGYPRYLFTFFPSGKDVNYLTKDLYYAEWNGTTITTPVKIHTALVRNIGVDDIVMSYMPNSCFDKNDPNIIIASKETDGVCEIYRIIRHSASSFYSSQVTRYSISDQWRPFSVAASKRNIFWLNKSLYTNYTSFSQLLVTKTV